MSPGRGPLAFNLLEKAGDSLHLVNPPISADAWVGAKVINVKKSKVIKLKRFMIKRNVMLSFL